MYREIEVWLLHRMRHLLSYCQGRAVQFWYQGRGLRIKFFLVMGRPCSVLKHRKEKKKEAKKPREIKGKECKAVQG